MITRHDWQLSTAHDSVTRLMGRNTTVPLSWSLQHNRFVVCLFKKPQNVFLWSIIILPCLLLAFFLGLRLYKGFQPLLDIRAKDPIYNNVRRTKQSNERKQLIRMPGSDCSDFGSKCTRWQRLYQDTLASLLYVGRIWRCAVQLSACRCFQLLKHLFPVKKLMWKLLNLLLDTTSFRKILLKLDKTKHLVKTIFSWKYTQIKICSFSPKELVPQHLSEAHRRVLNVFWTLEHQRQSN